MSEHDELLDRLRRLEAENRRLSARIDELSQMNETDIGEQDNDQQPVNRRGLLKRAGQVALGAAALAAGAEIATAPTAAAADGSPVLQGVINTPTKGTYLYADGALDYPALTVGNQTVAQNKNLSGGIDSLGSYGVFGSGSRAGLIGSCPAAWDTPKQVTTPAGVVGVGTQGTSGVLGTSDTGDGILGRGNGASGVHGNCQNDNGVGVFGDGSYGATGVYGHSGRGNGVSGISNEGNAVYGLAVTASGVGVLGVSVERSGIPAPAAAVTGDSKNQPGVQGFSQTARGGVFAGGQAAVRLLPGSLAGPPANGQNGDLYVDSAGRLWFYRGSWINLA